MKRILITGAAGFIGFHLARYLKMRGDFVIGLDNFNSYYDPLLKKERAQILSQEKIFVETGDIRDQNLLKKILSENEITHTVHLAAQAGVRHSLAHPEEYVASNLDGFASVLEATKKSPSA